MDRAEYALRFDTYPDHWRCAKCDLLEPHVHQEQDRRGVWRYKDWGYDERDGNPIIKERK